MKTFLFVILGVGILISNALGSAEVIIKKRARELNNQNNVRQGIAPPTQPPASPANSKAAAPNPALTKLQSDLGTVKPEGAVTPEQKQKIAADLIALAQSTKPTEAAAAKAAEDLANALSLKSLSSSGRGRLVQEIDAILNPSKYPQAKMPAIYDDIQAIFQENGTERRRAVAIVDDLKALVAH